MTVPATIVVAAIGLLILGGCSSRSPYAISPEQAQKHVTHFGPGGGPSIDMNHLPPGAVKHVQTFHKGDQLPDGTVADGDRQIVRVEVPIHK